MSFTLVFKNKLNGFNTVQESFQTFIYSPLLHYILLTYIDSKSYKLKQNNLFYYNN